MTSDCNDRQTARLLHAYELGLLSDEDRERVELHIHQCEKCFQELKETEQAARLLKYDAQVNRVIEAIVHESDHEEEQLRSSKVRRMVLSVGAIAAIVLILVLKDWRVDIHTSETVVAGENRVAILPFDNIVQPSDSARLGDIISDLLITDLSQSPSLQVVSSQYVYDLGQQVRASGTTENTEVRRIVTRRAGAKWLLDGAITQLSPEVVVTAQLVDVSSGMVKAATKVSAANDKGIFAAIDQLAMQIRGAMVPPGALMHESARSSSELTTSSSVAYQEYMKGVDLYRRFFRTEAEPHFRAAIRNDSTFAMPYYYLSLVASNPEARAFLDRAMTLSDRAGERDQYFIRSRSAYVSGDWQKALEILNAFVERYRDEKEPLLQLGMTEYNYGMYPKALVHLEAALALDSSYVGVLNHLAYTYERLDEFDNAMRALDRYTALAPNEPNPYDSRAEIYARRGRLDEAIESFQQALRIKPDFYASLIALGVMYAYDDRYASAESCFVAVTASSAAQDRRSAAMYRCFLTAYQGHFNQALKQMDECNHVDSAQGFYRHLPYRLFWKATVLDASGDSTAALRTMEQSIALEPWPDISDNTRKQVYSISLLVKNGCMDEARKRSEELRAALESAKVYGLPYCSARALMASKRGLPDSAVSYLEHHKAETREFYDQVRLGLAYLDAHRLTEAIAMLQKANSFYTPHRLFWSPLSVKLHYFLGRAYEESGMIAEASGEYRRFLDIWRTADPGIKEIADARNRLAALGPKPAEPSR